MTNDGDVFVVTKPLSWPAVAEPVSFSTFLVLRSCARRWAYGRSRFPPSALVDPRGFLHERANWGAIRGRAVHRTLEALLDLHQHHGGPAAGSWSLIQFWKRHLPGGGIPALLVTIVDDELTQVERSPRNRAQMAWLRQAASRDLGGLVASVNSKLALALQAGETRSRGQGAARRALTAGSHPEALVEADLRGTARSRRWKGKIDVAKIAPDAVRLIDYKGGTEEPSHREQLNLYALLYARDKTANPTGRLATELTLAYENGRTVSWPAPDEAELAAIELRIADELELLIEATTADPPVAQPGPENCAFCTARPLCDAYWRAPLPSDGQRIDLELLVEESSSTGDELVGRILKATRSGLLELARVVIPAAWRHAASGIQPQQRVRIVGATTVDSEEAATASVLLLDGFAELFRIVQ